MTVKNHESNLKGMSLKRNTLWNIFGNIIHSLSQWALIVIIAKLTNPEMVGIFSLGLALTAPLVLFLRFNLRMTVASDLTNEFNLGDYFTFRIYSSILFLASMFLLMSIYPTDIYTKAVVLSLSLGKVFESISDIIHADWQKKERFDFIAKSKIIKSFSSTLVFIIIMFLTKNLLIATISLSFMWLIFLVFYEKRIFTKYSEITFNFNKKTQFAIFKLTLPLGIAQLIASLNSNIPRYFIEYFHGIELLGIYSALIYIIVAGSNFILSISNVLVTRLAFYYKEGRVRRFIKLLFLPCMLTILCGISAVVCTYYYGEEILKIIYSSEYSTFNKVFTVMVIMGIIKYINVFLDAGITSTRKFKLLPRVNLITMITIVVFGGMLITKYGLIGAVYTLIIAESLQLFVRLFILIRLLQFKNNGGV